MPEYFEISLLFSNEKQNLDEFKEDFSSKFKIGDGDVFIDDSDFALLRKKVVSVLAYDFEGTNFYQFIIGFPDFIFHRKLFKQEIEEIIEFVEVCFELNDQIFYALCSYELNVYHLQDIDFLEDINEEIISKFPIAFVNKRITVGLSVFKKLAHSNLFVNHKAQDLFSIM